MTKALSVLKSRYITLTLMGLTILVLVLSIPDSLREALNRGGFYVFTQAFLDDIPIRLTGPGRFRFIMQPLIAVILGIMNGLADARQGRPPYLFGMVFHRELRRELAKTAWSTLANLLLMGIFLDAVFQWIIFGVVHPGAALILGPVLIMTPYVVARSFSNRFARRKRHLLGG